MGEQLMAIRKELGESDEVEQEIESWENKIKKANLPDYVLEAAEDELSKMKTMQPASSECSVIRNYLDWIVNIPWSKKTKDNYNLEKIEKILTKNHYGKKKKKKKKKK